MSINVLFARERSKEKTSKKILLLFCYEWLSAKVILRTLWAMSFFQHLLLRRNIMKIKLNVFNGRQINKKKIYHYFSA